MVVSPKLSNLSESSSFDQVFGGSKGTSEHYYSTSKGIFSQLLQRMHPSVCLGACNGESISRMRARNLDLDLNLDTTCATTATTNSGSLSVAGSGLRSIVPDIMKRIDCFGDESSSSGSLMHLRRKRNIALKSLYDLSSEKRNR
jgi:hypothetical protein